MSIVKDFKRLVVLTNDINLGPHFQPPTQQQIIQSVLDANYQLMISSGFFTQSQLTAFQPAAFAYFLAQFNIDFSSATPDPTTGIITVAPFVLIPYTSINSTIIKVSFDSENINRGSESNAWYGFQYGVIVAVEADGTFSGGIHQGDSYAVGDILTYANYVLNRSKGPVPVSTADFEVITFQSPYTSKTIVNSQNLTDTLSKLVCIDSTGATGFFMENITFEKLDDGTFETKTRVDMTWP